MSPPNTEMAGSDITMAESSLDPLFDEAGKAIQSAISEEEWKHLRRYADITSMLQDMRSICAANQKEHQRLLACSRKIALFANTFAPYFDIVNIFVQIRPDCLAWFWGSLRLVFKVGSKYVLLLESIADMFEAIAHVLPRYRQFYDTCREQSREARPDTLTPLMSYVYADIIQFCLELYRMFIRSSSGSRLRHCIGYVTAVLWRPLDSRFSQLQQRLDKHREWFDAEMAVQNFELLAQHRKELLEFMRSQGEANAELHTERMSRRTKRAEKIQRWLSSCDYQDAYEELVRQRHSKTCSWFLKTPEYRKWKDSPFDPIKADHQEALASDWHERILFVQAKPGYGKTVLSGQIINDLIAGIKDPNIEDEAPITVFFHFNSSHQDRNQASDAIRALAVQLVHAHKSDRKTLDALALLISKTSGQSKASSDDALSVLCLLLKQHPTFLVIDGIDECNDAENFLTVVPELCRLSDCRVILLSRPDLDIPLEYQQWASDSPHIISLDETDNASDISVFITENMSRMADQGYFGINVDRTIFPLVASRSNGMFLWAKLLIQYLQSPALSPNERRVALESASLLEGLDSLYRSILNMLERRFGPEKRIAADIFRWLSLSIKPLNVAAIHTALAITPGQPITKDQYLANFTDSISRLTCALVEVKDGEVRFIHRSVKEYLQSPACQDSDFSLFNEGIVHGHLAARCISYLANDAPKRPLQRLRPYRPPINSIATSSGMSFQTSSSGDSGYKSMSSSDTEGLVAVPITAPTDPPFDADMPFLRYAALCWPVHLSRALSTKPPRPSSNSSVSDTVPFSHTPWLPVLSQFLTDRAAVTAWVEASWRYNLPPNLSRLVPLLLNMKSGIPPATIEGRELRWVVCGLRQLSDALNELRGDYGVTLRENASLIWQWNIQAATEGGFWPVWDERRQCVHEVQT